MPQSCKQSYALFPFYENATNTKMLNFNWAPRHEGVLGEWRYNFTHALTSALDGGE
jgi:hypothetical protein